MTNNEAQSDKAIHKKGSVLSYILKFGLPLVISVGLCYLLFTGIDFNEMIEIIRRDCNYSYIALAMFISIFSHVFRALRWRIQLRALDVRPPLFYLVLSIFGTYAVNLIFPRLGEVWRSGYIAQRQKAPFTAVFGSMVAERLADTVTVALITVLAFLLSSKAIMSYLSQNTASYEAVASLLTSPWLWLAVVACVAFVWWFVRRRSENPAVVRIQKIIHELWTGFAVIFKMPGKGMWLFWTVCLWGCFFIQMFVAFFAFPATAGVFSRYGLAAVLVTFALSSISMGVPSNGGIGPWQWAVIFALGIYGVDATTAGAFANVVLGSQTMLLIVLGIFTFVCIAADRRHTGAHDSTETTNNNIKQTKR